VGADDGHDGAGITRVADTVPLFGENPLKTRPEPVKDPAISPDYGQVANPSAVNVVGLVGLDTFGSLVVSVIVISV
jgi:hypothetical protein